MGTSHSRESLAAQSPRDKRHSTGSFPPHTREDRPVTHTAAAHSGDLYAVPDKTHITNSHPTISNNNTTGGGTPEETGAFTPTPERPQTPIHRSRSERSLRSTTSVPVNMPSSSKRKKASKPLLEKKVRFLGRFFAGELNEVTYMKLRQHTRFRNGVKTRLRLSVDGVGCGHKYGTVFKHKLPAEFMPLRDVVDIVVDDKMLDLLLIISRCPDGSYEILSFRMTSQSEGFQFQHTYAEIQYNRLEAARREAAMQSAMNSADAATNNNWLLRNDGGQANGQVKSSLNEVMVKNGSVSQDAGDYRNGEWVNVTNDIRYRSVSRERYSNSSNQSREHSRNRMESDQMSSASALSVESMKKEIQTLTREVKQLKHLVNQSDRHADGASVKAGHDEIDMHDHHTHARGTARQTEVQNGVVKASVRDYRKQGDGTSDQQSTAHVSVRSNPPSRQPHHVDIPIQHQNTTLPVSTTSTHDPRGYNTTSSEMTSGQYRTAEGATVLYTTSDTTNQGYYVSNDVTHDANRNNPTPSTLGQVSTKHVGTDAPDSGPIRLVFRRPDEVDSDRRGRSTTRGGVLYHDDSGSAIYRDGPTYYGTGTYARNVKGQIRRDGNMGMTSMQRVRHSPVRSTTPEVMTTSRLPYSSRSRSVESQGRLRSYDDPDNISVTSAIYLGNHPPYVLNVPRSPDRIYSTHPDAHAHHYGNVPKQRLRSHSSGRYDTSHDPRPRY